MGSFNGSCESTHKRCYLYFVKWTILDFYIITKILPILYTAYLMWYHFNNHNFDWKQIYLNLYQGKNKQ